MYILIYLCASMIHYSNGFFILSYYQLANNAELGERVCTRLAQVVIASSFFFHILSTLNCRVISFDLESRAQSIFTSVKRGWYKLAFVNNVNPDHDIQCSYFGIYFGSLCIWGLFVFY